MFAAVGSSPIKRMAVGSSVLNMAPAKGSSPFPGRARGVSSMLVPLLFLNFMETGSASGEVDESGAQADNIIETGET